MTIHIWSHRRSSPPLGLRTPSVARDFSLQRSAWLVDSLQRAEPNATKGKQNFKPIMTSESDKQLMMDVDALMLTSAHLSGLHDTKLPHIALDLFIYFNCKRFNSGRKLNPLERLSFRFTRAADKSC